MVQHSLAGEEACCLHLFFPHLAAGGRPVTIHLEVRRFFCGSQECELRTFAEQVPAVTQRHQRRTAQLGSVLEAVALALAGRAGARPASALGIAVSRTTLIRLIRALPDPAIGQVTVLGVDDFAKRRGHSQQVKNVRNQVIAAAAFLDWPDARGLTLDMCTQGDLDQWLAGNSGYLARSANFVRWAVARRHASRLTAPPSRSTPPARPLDHDRRGQTRAGSSTTTPARSPTGLPGSSSSSTPRSSTSSRR